MNAACTCARSALRALLYVTLALPTFSQSTQSIIRGRVLNAVTGEPVAGAQVSYFNAKLNQEGGTETDARGDYVLSSLSPGDYRIRIEKKDYQARDVYSLTLFVASRLDVSTELRPLAGLRAATPHSISLGRRDGVLPVLDADFELGRSETLDVPFGKSATLQSALSYAIDPQQVGELPLAARNVYTMMVTLPGVIGEEVTGRGLGLVVNGQRASSSNFLLDGVENNDYLLTGRSPPSTPKECRNIESLPTAFRRNTDALAGLWPTR